MATHESNGNGAHRRELALAEVEALARQLLQDARNMATGLEAILAEVNTAREGKR